MPNLADLPPELFSAVLGLALDDSDIKRLCSLSLLSRRWHAALLGRIYSEWTYNGARQPFLTLWKFLRTVRSDPYLAALVRTLNIGNWGFYPNVLRDEPAVPDLELPQDEVDSARDVINEAGISHLEDGIVDSLPKRDRRPLMALLLTCLPNLNTVYAHVPRSDPVLEAVLKQVTDRQNAGSPSPALRELRELHLIREISATPRKSEYDSDEDSDDEQEKEDPYESSRWLRLDHVWPVFRLVGLRTLSLFDFDTKKTAAMLANSAGVCHLEHLCLVGSTESFLESPDVQALIAKPESLKSLSFYLHDSPFTYSSESIISNAELWNCLQKHKHSLEYIDIYNFAPLSAHRRHFGPLRMFTRLKHLCVHETVLLGGQYELPRAPFRLKDTIPSTLESLTIYGEPSKNIATDLPTQLLELIRDGNFPSLKSIVFEELVNHAGDKVSLELLRHQAFRQACAKNDIGFRIESGSQLRKGGSNYDLWSNTLYMQDDGADRNITDRFRDRQELLLHPREAVFDDEYDGDSDYGYGPYGGGTVKVHNIPFTDHTGRTAYMVFENSKDYPLPPVFSFSIYFTHVNSTPGSADMTGLHEEVSPGDQTPVRFDMHFLPGASHGDCISHHLGELAARGSYKAQLRMFDKCSRDEVHPLPGTPGQLPGMVKKYNDLGGSQGFFLICPEQDWREGQRTLLSVHFDKGEAKRGNMENSDVNWHPMNEKSPVWDYDDMDQGHQIDGTLFDLAHWHTEIFIAPWRQATSRGWTSW
jgi:hypothetical protein